LGPTRRHKTDVRDAELLLDAKFVWRSRATGGNCCCIGIAWRRCGRGYRTSPQNSRV